MKIRTFILAAAAILAVAVSCKKEKPVLGVSIDPATLSFTADGGTLTVKATSSDPWTLSVPAAAQEWLQVSPLSGSGDVTVTVTASGNPGKPRAVTVNFTAGLFTEPLSITQEGKQKAGDGKSLETAFSASEAHDWVMQNLGEGEVSTDRFFVKGIIHKMVTSSGAEQYFASNSYGNASFYISDDGQTSDQDFECFQVNYLGNRAWKTGDTDVKVGDQVAIYGFVTNFKGNTAETTGKGAAYLVQLNDKVVEPTVESKADPKGSGTKEDPFNVAAAINAVQNLKYTSTSDYEKIENVYVKGVISDIKSVDTGSFGNAEYSIVDEGFTTVFGVYRGFYLGGEKFTKQDQIKVGDKVTILGAICNMFGNTPQFTTGNYIVEINGEKMKEPDMVSGDVTACIAAADNDQVVVNDAIVAALSAQGFILTDGKSNVYVYEKANPSVKIGDKVKVEAKKTTYYGLPEFIEPKVTVASSGNNVPRTELKDVTATIDSYASSVAEYVNVAGTLVKDGDYFNVEVPGAARKATPSSLHSSFKLDGLVGKRVNMSGYFNTIHSSKNLLQIVVTDVSEVSADEKYCTVNPQEITVKATETETSVTISSNAPWVADNISEGIVVSPNEGTGDAKLTIFLSANEGQEGRDFSFRVFSEAAGVEQQVRIHQEGAAESAAHSVTASLAVADGATFDFYEATVAAVSTKGFIVTDGENNVYVYLNAAPGVKAGDKVDFTATFQADYYGLPEYKNAKDIKVLSSGNEIPRTAVVELGKDNIDTYSSGKADYLCVTGKLEKNGNYWNVKPEGATRYASPDYMISSIDPSALEGQQVKFYGYFNTIHSGNNYVKVIATEFLPADDNVKYLSVSPDALQFAAAGGELSLAVTANQAWTVSTQDQFLEVSPASGEGNGTVKVICAENPAETGRTGSIIINGADNKTIEIAVSQGAKLPEGSGSVTWNKAKLAAASDQGAVVTMDDVISFTNDSNYNGTNVTELRIYKGKNFVVTAAAGYKITSITFSCSASGTTKQGPGCWGEGAPSGYSYEDKVGTWTGEQQSVSFNAKENQVRIEELTVTYKAD